MKVRLVPLYFQAAALHMIAGVLALEGDPP